MVLYFYPAAFPKGCTTEAHDFASAMGKYRALGATVIGTVGSDDKAKFAKSQGCDHPIVYTRDDFVKRVAELTNGAKVPVVYDSVGKETFMRSLDCLQPLGLMVSFGNSSGPVENLNLGILASKGSLFLTRPTLYTYAAKRDNLVAMGKELFDVVLSGAVKIEVNQTCPLKEVARAPGGWFQPAFCRLAVSTRSASTSVGGRSSSSRASCFFASFLGAALPFFSIWVTRTAPISAVACTWVPPQGCRSSPAISISRTRPVPIGGFTDNLEPFLLKQSLQSLADHLMVICQKDTYRHLFPPKELELRFPYLCRDLN